MIYGTIFRDTTLALTFFRLGVLGRGSYFRSYFRRQFGRCFSGHFLFIEEGESSTVTQFPESIQEKDGGESQ